MAKPLRSLTPALAAWFRRDALVIALYVLVACAISYPLIEHLSTQLVVYRGPDILGAYWQNWSLERTVREGLDPNHTPYLFHPKGLDTTLQPRRWIGLITWLPLAKLFGPTAAFNLEALGALVLTAYAIYLLVLELLGSRIAAWGAGAFATCYPQHTMQTLARPNTGRTEWIAVFLWLLVLLLRCPQPSAESPSRRRERWLVVLTGAAGALSAYVNFKLFILAGLLGGAYVLFFAALQPAAVNLRFCARLLSAGALAVLLAAPIYVPYLHIDWLEHGVDQTPLRGGVDLSAYYTHLLGLPPLLHATLARGLGLSGRPFLAGAYWVGASGVALALWGLAAFRKQWRQTLPWLLCALVMVALSLGTELQIGGDTFEGVVTPYALVAKTSLFKALRFPPRMSLVFALAFSVLVGHGLSGLMRALGGGKLAALGGMLGCGLIVLELSSAPLRLQNVHPSQFLVELGQRSKGCALIDLPMGRQPSKRWMFEQAFHGMPIVEGMAARMPPRSYDYISRNPLLKELHGKGVMSCRYDSVKAVSQLTADGFCYVAVHRVSRSRASKLQLKNFARYFSATKPLYQDEALTVYDLRKYRKPADCDGEAAANAAADEQDERELRRQRKRERKAAKAAAAAAAKHEPKSAADDTETDSADSADGVDDVDDADDMTDTTDDSAQ